MYMCYIFFEGKNCQKEYNIFRSGNFSISPATQHTNHGEREKENEKRMWEMMETNYLLTENQNSETPL